jgi:hypothetical protein
LKADLSPDTFCCELFDATDAAFRTGRVLCNLLMGLCEMALPSCRFERQLRTARDLVFRVWADLIPQSCHLQNRLAVSSKRCPKFLKQPRTLFHGMPIAAQLDWDLTEVSDIHHASPGQADTIVPTDRPRSYGAGFPLPLYPLHGGIWNYKTLIKYSLIALSHQML